MIMRAKIKGSRTNFGDGTCVVQADEITHALMVISYPHHEVHEGKMWSCEDSSANLGGETGDHINLQFTTPIASMGLLHAIFDAWVSGAATYTLREAQTGGGTGGGAADVYNHRRDKTDNPGFIIYKDNAVGTGGKVLINKPLGAGVGGNAQNAGSRDNNERVLAPATLYQVRVYAAAAVIGYVNVNFYLHKDK